MYNTPRTYLAFLIYRAIESFLAPFKLRKLRINERCNVLPVTNSKTRQESTGTKTRLSV